MPELFTCPHCGTKTLVDDKYRGQTGRCVSCNAVISIPNFDVGDVQRDVGRTTRRVVAFVASASVILVLIAIFVTQVVRVGGSSMQRIANNRVRGQSIANLEKIAKALNNYAADHGRYPPPVVKDAKGKPMHSWRVMLLPYLQEDDLFNQYDTQRAWNDPANLNLQYAIPAVFQHPLHTPGSFQSDYYLVTGPQTLFPKGGPLSPDDLVDSPAQTILVVEAMPIVPSGSWTEPIDLGIGGITGDLTVGSAAEPGGLSPGGVTVVTVDGRGHFVPDNFEPSTVRALLTPAGGERLRDDTLD
ncbi:MAG: DUF1559 domain-containing protein [Planctomycetota bacterium]